MWRASPAVANLLGSVLKDRLGAPRGVGNVARGDDSALRAANFGAEARGRQSFSCARRIKPQAGSGPSGQSDRVLRYEPKGTNDVVEGRQHAGKPHERPIGQSRSQQNMKEIPRSIAPVLLRAKMEEP